MASRKVDYPPVGFYFKVNIKRSNGKDASFAEVSGLSAVISTEEITEGGENRFKHRLPSVMTYPPLVLKRGLVKSDSPLIDWILTTLKDGYLNPIKPEELVVTLMNEKKDPIKAWHFDGAYPIKYEVSALKSDSNQIVMETVEFSYRTMVEE